MVQLETPKGLNIHPKVNCQPKITKISRTHFPGECSRAEQGLGQVRGRDGPEGGRPASPRPAGLGILTRGHRPSDSGSDHSLEAVGSWSRVGFAVARPAGLGEAGRPPSSPSRPLTWPRPCSALGHSPRKWVPATLVLLGCFVDLWMDVEAFRCIQLNQGLTLDLEPLECVTLPLV